MKTTTTSANGFRLSALTLAMTGTLFASQVLAVSTLGDRVWNDLNQNGIQDCVDTNGNGIIGDVNPAFPGDPAQSDQGAECSSGVADTVVNIYEQGEIGCDFMVFDTTQTDEQGFYQFTFPGGFSGCVQFVSDCDFTAQDAGDDEIDSDPNVSNGLVIPVVVSDGQQVRNVDAGLLCEAPPVEPACLVIIDEDSIDNGISTIEEIADLHGVQSDWLVNDDKSTEGRNKPLRWNQNFPGDVVLLPTGQIGDEGWFVLPENPVGKNGPFTVEDFFAGTVNQSKLDEVGDVMPLGNADLVNLVGRTCTAVVYDSDVSMNYDPNQANLQGERLGLFDFTVLSTQNPGSIDESGSSDSLDDVWVRVESPQ